MGLAVWAGAACSADLATEAPAARTYCATTQGLVHQYAWPWNDSTASWSEVALANSSPVGAGYCLTFRYESETSGTFQGGGSFGAWFDIRDLGLVDTIPLWYLRDAVASGTFAIRGGMMWLAFDRGGAFLADRPFLQHTAPDEAGFLTAGTTATQGAQGYLFFVLPWRRPVAAETVPPGGEASGSWGSAAARQTR